MQGYFYADLILSGTTGDLIFFYWFFITHSQEDQNVYSKISQKKQPFCSLK
ncbi:hypothetical protein HMPREF1015_01541 [Bacillus smithii 7_3_47FAA]|uniref:Uncharacterized protein n=1 Tax=Bacillus smithii 7_3_47FAA TaxID=665952 RepID=G9QK02_9BACI|nr:hypothetical protein HMPREF1015_01541 [Bacillus smithii 7_3_47FAA]